MNKKMPKNRFAAFSNWKSILFATLCIGISSSTWAAKLHASPETIHNLETAIQGEANASLRYKLFAAKAEKDGYPQVARLFRAASEAESIHQENHQTALSALGGPIVKLKIAPVKVGSTRQNLEGPIKGEAKEQQEMYPRYIQQAKKDHADLVVRTFNFARKTEAEHEQLFKKALSQLGHNPPEDYYVSQISGDTVAVPAGQSFANKKGGDYILIS